MGTSMKVPGLRKLVKEFTKVVHEHKSGEGKVLFVNKTPPTSEWHTVFDIHVEGETDAWVTKVIEEWKNVRPQDWEVQTTLLTSGSVEETSGFKVVKQATAAPKPKGSYHIYHILSFFV